MVETRSNLGDPGKTSVVDEWKGDPWKLSWIPLFGLKPLLNPKPWNIVSSSLGIFRLTGKETVTSGCQLFSEVQEWT